MSRWAVFAAGLLAFATGCSTEHSLEYTLVSDPPQSVLLADDLIEIPAGVAVAARIVAIEDDARRPDRVRMIPQRVGIIGVEEIVDGDREFALWGMEPGRTEVDVFFDGEKVLELEAVVTDPRIGAP